jgi:Carboxypeptidase regulatory-like domain
VAFRQLKLLVMACAILRVLPLLIFGAQAAFGCSMQSMELRQVSSDLTIVVTHRGRPIAGITVQVVPENSADPVFTGATDERGTALIEGLMIGRYDLTASFEGFDAGKEWIEVVAVPDAKTKKRFDFQWADWSHQTRRVAGTLTGLVPGDTGHPLMDIVHPKETVFAGVDITLKNALSGNEYRTVSDSTGTFLIGGVPDGIYIMTIAGGMKAISGTADITKQVIDVTHAAKVRKSLPLQLKDTGCYHTEFALPES